MYPFLFGYMPAGTGKTILCNTLCALERSDAIAIFRLANAALSYAGSMAVDLSHPKGHSRSL